MILECTSQGSRCLLDVSLIWMIRFHDYEPFGTVTNLYGQTIIFRNKGLEVVWRAWKDREVLALGNAPPASP